MACPESGAEEGSSEKEHLAQTFEERFKAFVRGSIGCRVLDDEGPLGEGHRMADFLLADNSIVAELKCIAASRANKLQGYVDRECTKRGIGSYGRLPFSAVFEHQADSEEIHRHAYKTVGLPLEEDFREANNQIKETKLRLQLPSAFGLLILANTSNEVLTFDLARWLLCKLMLKRKPDGSPACSAVDCIWYLTEIRGHQMQTARGGRLLPSLLVPRDDRHEYAALDRALLKLQEAWAAFNGMPFTRP